MHRARRRHQRSLKVEFFGTFFEVSIGRQHDFDRDEVQAGVLAVLNEVDRQMSTYRQDSVLTAVNQAPIGEPVAVPPELYYVLRVGLRHRRAKWRRL